MALAICRWWWWWWWIRQLLRVATRPLNMKLNDYNPMKYKFTFHLTWFNVHQTNELAENKYLSWLREWMFCQMAYLNMIISTICVCRVQFEYRYRYMYTIYWTAFLLSLDCYQNFRGMFVVNRWSSISVMPIYTRIGFWSNSCSRAVMAVRLFSCYASNFRI